MLHPSYTDLMSVVNSEVEPGEQPLVQSRYSIVLATAKRARQIVGNPALYAESDKKPLSRAVDELYHGAIKILADDQKDENVSGEEAQAFERMADEEFDPVEIENDIPLAEK